MLIARFAPVPVFLQAVDSADIPTIPLRGGIIFTIGLVFVVVLHVMATRWTLADGRAVEKLHNVIVRPWSNLPQTLIAFELNDEGEIPAKNGAPARLRVETSTGFRSLKWLERIEVVNGTLPAPEILRVQRASDVSEM